MRKFLSVSKKEMCLMMLIVTSKHTTETLTNEFLVFSLADAHSACRLNSVTHTELLVRPKQRITDDAAYLPTTLSALCVSSSVMNVVANSNTDDFPGLHEQNTTHMEVFRPYK